MHIRSVTFYSEGVRLAGDIYLPDDAAAGAPRAGILLCHGYTGVKDLYLPDNAAALVAAGYVVMTFDYKGWGASDGPPARLDPHGRVADAAAALTFLGLQPEVDEARLGLYGTSYGGGTAIWLAATDIRAKCVVSVVGVGDGARWMRSVRHPDEWYDLLARAEVDRAARVTTGRSELVERDLVLLPDRQSAALAAEARRGNPGAVDQVPLEYVDETLAFNPLWVVGRIAPRPALFITAADDRLVPPEQSEAMYVAAGEPKRIVVLPGFGHYDVYRSPAFDLVMEHTLSWFRTHLSPRDEV